MSVERASAGEFAILSSLGPAAVAVISFSGPGATEFVARYVRPAKPSTPQTAWRVSVRDDDGELLDEALLRIHTHVGQPEFHLNLHGNPALVRRVAELLRSAGFLERAPVDVAEPGTPTQSEDHSADAAADPSPVRRDLRQARRFSLDHGGGAAWLERDLDGLLGKMLTVRGAVWLLDRGAALRQRLEDVVGSGEAASALAAELAAQPPVLDWFARPLRVALLGPPNAGKSTLANALAGQRVSLVSPIPGTTRDWVETVVECDGFPIAWVDTAGLRAAADELEAAGIERTHRVAATCDVVVVVLDGCAAARPQVVAFLEHHSDLRPTTVLVNKSDAPDFSPADLPLPANWRALAMPISAAKGVGVSEFVGVLLTRLGRTPATLAQSLPTWPRLCQALGLSGDV